MDEDFHLRTEDLTMNTKLIRAAIDLIRAEEERRVAELPSENTNAAYDRYVFTDLPFVNELYLMLLVAMWHQIEKELICLAARVDGSTDEMTQDDHKKAVYDLAKKRPKERWPMIEGKLRLKTFSDHKTLKLLQKLANTYKHDPFGRPSEKLLKCLNLQPGVPYAYLPASDETAEGLCKALGLDSAEGYSGIAAAFLKSAEQFLAKLNKETKLRPIERRSASLNPNHMER